MHRTWSVRPDRLVLAGTIADAPGTGFDFHRHPVVQVTVGLGGALMVVLGDDRMVTSLPVLEPLTASNGEC